MPAAPVAPITAPGSSVDASLVILLPLVGLSLLLLAAAAISPAYVPWRRVAIALAVHRPDVALLGFGALGIALALFFYERLTG